MDKKLRKLARAVADEVRYSDDPDHVKDITDRVYNFLVNGSPDLRRMSVDHLARIWWGVTWD